MFINQVDHESKPRENDEGFRILKPHNDDEDYGMASMCYFGNYGGGNLVLPDLHTTIIARPGDIVLICAYLKLGRICCISTFGRIYPLNYYWHANNLLGVFKISWWGGYIVLFQI